MSVINNVLKQLDDRPSQFAPIKLSVNDEEYRRSIFQPLFWGLLIILLALVLYFSYEKIQQSRLAAQKNSLTSVKLPAETDVKVQAEEKLLATATNIKLVTQQDIEAQAVTGLQINETAGSLNLTLQLESGAQGFLRYHAKNRYIFQISNTHKKIVAPDIQQNAWLRNVEIRQNASGAEIQFDTGDRVLVETRGLRQGDGYEWLINLKKVPETKHEVVKETVAAAPVQQKIQLRNLAVVEPKSESPKPEKQTSKTVKLRIKPVVPLLSDDKKYSKAILALQQGNWSSAQQQLQALVGSRADRKARKSLLALYEGRSATTALRILLQQSLQLYPGDPDFRLMDAGKLFAAKQYATLIGKYKSEAVNKNIINLLASTLQSQGDHAAAIETYRRSLQLDANQPRILISMAISFEQQKQFSQALQAYQSAQHSGALNLRLQQFVRKRISQLSKAG